MQLILRLAAETATANHFTVVWKIASAENARRTERQVFDERLRLANFLGPVHHVVRDELGYTNERENTRPRLGRKGTPGAAACRAKRKEVYVLYNDEKTLRSHGVLEKTGPRTVQILVTVVCIEEGHNWLKLRKYYPMSSIQFDITNFPEG